MSKVIKKFSFVATNILEYVVFFKLLILYHNLRSTTKKVVINLCSTILAKEEVIYFETQNAFNVAKIGIMATNDKKSLSLSMIYTE